MRIPEKPPSDDEFMASGQSMDQDAIRSIEELRSYLAIVNSEYLHWDELRTRFGNTKLNLKLLWRYATLIREFHNRPINLDGLTLRYVQTPEIEKALHGLDMRVGGKSAFENQIPSIGLQKKYLVNSLMEEAIASSQLEGAVTTRIVAKQMLREKRKPKNLSEQMILNNYITMMYIKDNTQPNQPLTSDFIKEIHKKITKDTLEKIEYEGVFRVDNEVRVLSTDRSQIIYEPPDHHIINNLIEQVCSFANSEPSNFYLHPIIKAVLLHYMIGYIHPFYNGNGRTARALFYWYLISQNYKWLEYVAISTAIKSAPSKYAHAYLYSETDHNDITYFVKFNLRQLDIALKKFEEYIGETMLENKKIFDAIKDNKNLNFRQADVIINLGKNERPITLKEMQERYNITYETARRDLLGLVKLGCLQMNVKGRHFVFLLDKDKCMMMSPSSILQKQLSDFRSKTNREIANNQN